MPKNSFSLGWAEAFSTDPKQFVDLFAKMLNGFMFCKIVTDKDGKPIDWIYLDVNDAFERIMGIKRENAIGKRVTELLADENSDPADWIGKYGEVALTRVPVQFEAYMQSIKRWLSVSAYSPKKGYFISIFEDITARKKSEEALRESEKRFRIMADGTPSMLWVTDKEGRNLFVNKYYQEYFRVNYEQVEGDKWQPLFHPEDGSQYIEKFFEALRERKPFSGQACVRRGDGQWRWLESTGTPRFSLDNEFLGYVGISIDITERKQAEDAVRQSEERLKRSQEIAHLGSWELDIINDKLTWSDEVYRIFGLKPQEFGATYEAFLDYVHPDDRGLVDCAYSGSLAEGRDSYEVEHRVVRKDTGEIRFVHEKCTHLRDKSGQIIGSVGMVHDITERKLMEQQLEKYTKQLEKLVNERTKQLKDAERLAAIGATAGMVGHDIRNPLQAITSDVYLLKDYLTNMPEMQTKKDVYESLDGIEKNVEYIDKIVQDLQDYARPLQPVVKETDFEEVCRDVLVKRAIPESIDAACYVDEDARKAVADPSLVKRILANLVNNAVQAMPKGGKLRIHAYREANDTVITVQDTGVGIPEDLRPKLFTPLFTTKSKGQGFGLAVVKRMTEALGGSVTFESQEGMGTKFIVRFPSSKELNDKWTFK